ncbi:MAG: hypothetical protein JWQ98_2620 [Chlorobi bacterium]|jgi:hypothetical protein|nr:hypothetical protein [Chlorobiota bacterium]
MAKTQTFQDKSKKKGLTDLISVKVVVMNQSEKGTYKFNERFIKVKDLAEVEKAVRG